jgi:hypothetical protein
MTTRSLPSGKSRLVTRYRVIVSLLLALAAAAMYVAFISAKEPEPNITNSLNVVAVRPDINTTAVSRQTRIYAKLKSGFVGSLVVNGTEIPAEQVDHLEGSNTVGFTPGPGTAVGPLKPGQNCALVFYWHPEESRATAESFKWCWKVSN